MKILVVRAEKGEVIGSEIMENDLLGVVRSVTRRAVELWNPLESDFIVLKESREIEFPLPVSEEVVSWVKRYGEFKAGKRFAKAVIPIYTISYDNKTLSEQEIVERGVFVITLYINEYVKEIIEAEASGITSEPERPEGLRELE